MLRKYSMRVIFLILLLVHLAHAADWAVIVAGSTGYWNYRHQAAAASAYQYFISHGIPKKNIIVFMSTSVAQDERNPFKGKLYSTTSSPPTNQMEGVEVEYSGGEVTANRVLNVLAGNSFSGKRVLRSNIMDTVYLAFFEYGAPGVITLPKDAIFGVDFANTISIMHDKKMYKELVISIDGKGTEHLLEGLDLKSLHVRLSSPYTQNLENRNLFCPPHDIVNGRSIGSCLSTEYSYINWDYGTRIPSSEDSLFSNEPSMVNQDSTWSVYDSKFMYLMNQYLKDPKSVQYHRAIQDEDNTRSQIEKYYRLVLYDRKVGDVVSGSITEWDCYKRGVKKVEKLFLWNEYTFRFFGLIVNLCEQNKFSF